MSSYKHKSGARKRSEKEKRDEETVKGSRTLFQVGVRKAAKETGNKPTRKVVPEDKDALLRQQLDGELETQVNEEKIDAEEKIYYVQRNFNHHLTLEL